MASDLMGWARRQQAPFTIGLIASLTAVALWGWFTMSQNFGATVATSENAFSEPYRLLLYPWATQSLANLFFFVLFIYWLFWVGTEVEREMGTGRFAAFWFLATLVLGLTVTAGGRALNVPTGIYGAWLPEAAVTVLWGARNRTAQVRLMLILPLNGMWLAVLAGAAAVAAVGAQHPVVGLFTAIPLGLTWAFGQNLLPIAVRPGQRRSDRVTVVRGGARYDDKYFDDVKAREKEREERERLRKLFEGK